MPIAKAKLFKYINDHQLTKERFEWQEGYGVFSSSQSAGNDVFRYIENQEARQQEQIFRDEY